MTDIEPIADKWKAFGWHVIEVNGHDFSAIDKAVNEEIVSKPKMIICHTVKGKGVSFMENNVEFHGKPPTDEQCTKALEELR